MMLFNCNTTMRTRIKRKRESIGEISSKEKKKRIKRKQSSSKKKRELQGLRLSKKAMVLNLRMMKSKKYHQ